MVPVCGGTPRERKEKEITDEVVEIEEQEEEGGWSLEERRKTVFVLVFHELCDFKMKRRVIFVNSYSYYAKQQKRSNTRGPRMEKDIAGLKGMHGC